MQNHQIASIILIACGASYLFYAFITRRREKEKRKAMNAREEHTPTAYVNLPPPPPSYPSFRRSENDILFHISNQLHALQRLLIIAISIMCVMAFHSCSIMNALNSTWEITGRR